MRPIEWEDMPRVYDLSVETKDPAIIVAVNHRAIREARNLLLRPSPMIKPYQELNNIPEFIPPSGLDRAWGYGEVLEPIGEDSDMVRLRCKLPVIVPDFNSLKRDHESAMAISTTLNVLFTTLSVVEEPEASERLQLIRPDLVSDKSLHYGGWSLEVSLAKSLLPYIAEKSAKGYHDRRLEGLMKSAYGKIMSKELAALGDYQVTFRNRWVNLQCPGNAAGLDPDDFAQGDEDEGYKLAPHNVDGPAQQLTLLYVIAAMNQEAREMGY